MVLSRDLAFKLKLNLKGVEEDGLGIINLDTYIGSLLGTSVGTEKCTRSNMKKNNIFEPKEKYKLDGAFQRLEDLEKDTNVLLR